ncbi:MAG: 5-formyltetrahydrofolate cyclo-ligase [Gammaproteobacteria bacterium]|nr:5-formyltetrahydrofolate cyclo-ligase [Gammaproteobacteria bacterium]
MPPSEKHLLRRFHRAARRALSAEEQREHALAIADEVMKRLDPAATVAVYLARDGEVDLKNVIESCWRRRIVIALPVLRGREMRFAEYRCGTPLEPNRFGIAEPSAGEREGLAPRMKEPSAGEREGPAPRREEPSAGEREGPAPRREEPAQPEFVTPTIVLAPLVAFDGRGHRLGMGGGYYDRFFAATPDAARIGIAHECQRVSTLPATSSDVSLTAVVTENGWQAF